MCEFHYDYIKSKYSNNSRLLFTDTDSSMCKMKSKAVYKDFSKDKKMIHLSNYSTKLKYYNDSNKLLVDKMKAKTADVATKEFEGLKTKMHSFSVDDGSEHKTSKCLYKNSSNKSLRTKTFYCKINDSDIRWI